MMLVYPSEGTNTPQRARLSVQNLVDAGQAAQCGGQNQHVIS